MSELNLTHSNGNKVKLITPDTLGADKTFKLPDADVTTATFQIVPPVFRAIRSDYQVLSNNTDTVIEFDNDSSSVSFDSNGFYNTSNYRFTPTIAGYYQLTAQLEFSLNTGNNLFGLMIFKNGSEYLRIRRWNDGSNSNVNINITGIVPFNGSSDYAQVYGWQNSGGNITVFQGSGRSYFEGLYLRPLI